ncbi:MAG: hypothetical protein JRJ24_10325 [Deltaproteobacteria bacterium]|nr:hypothetical protein [Deltaproteobacteria bacterium]
MKNTLIVLVLVLFSSTASAQDVCPEFANMVNVIGDDGAASKELGMEKAVAKQKKKGIYRGHDTSVRLEAPEAKVAVKPSQSFSFKPFHANIHPGQQIKLYPFDTKKKYRELSVGGTNMWGGSKNRKAKDDSIGLTFKKISDGCYKVTAEGALPKGQYAFSLGSSADVQGTNAGWGTSTSGQVWFGFSIK